MADDQQLVFEFVAEESGLKKAFDNVEKQGEKTADKLNSGFGKKDIFGTDKAIDFKNILGEVGESAAGAVGKFGKLGIAIGGVIAVGVALKESFDLALDGEKINQINTSFEILASQAGANVQKLRSDLEDAAGGVADMEAVLKTASIAVNEFGGQAEKIPELLRVARAAALQFGGSVEERFSTLVNAVASGNTRALREIGLFVDAGKAVDQFALSVGRARGELTQVGERQAVLNAVLEKSGKVFAGVDIENKSLAQSTASVSVALKEINDSLALIANAAFGQVFTDIASGVGDLARAIAGLGPEAKTPTLRIREIDAELAKLQERMNSLAADNTENNKKIEESANFYNKQVQGQAGFFETIAQSFSDSGIDPQFFKSKVDGVVAEMKRLGDERKKLADALKPGEQEALFNDSAAKDALAKSQKFQEQLRQINNETAKLRVDNAIASATLEEQERLRVEEAERQSNERKLAIARQFSADLSLLDQQTKQFNIDRKKLSDEQELQVERDLAARRADVIRQKNALLSAEEARGEQERLNILRDSAQKMQEEETKRQKTMLDLTKQFYNGLVSVGVAGIARIGASLREGGNAFEGFLGQVLNILGDLAIQIGTTLIGIGFGIDNLKIALFSLSGGVAIAAGFALVALGGLLKSFASVNGAGGGASPSTGTGGGISSGGGISGDTNPGTAFVPPEDQEAQGPKTEINLSVNGNILGTSDKSLALALSDILSDNFSSQGLVIKG